MTTSTLYFTKTMPILLSLGVSLTMTLSACGDASGESLASVSTADDVGKEALVSIFPCTEQGIIDAIAEGGGPHGFACDGPTTVVTDAEIAIDNDVMLDGLEELIVDGNDAHLVFSVSEGATAELRGFTITGGASNTTAGGVANHGTLTLANSIVSQNAGDDVGGIFNDDLASLTMTDSVVQKNIGNGVGGIQNENRGNVKMTSCTVMLNSGGNVDGIDNGGDGIVTVKGSIVLDPCHGNVSSDGDNMMGAHGASCGYDEAKGDMNRLVLEFF